MLDGTLALDWTTARVVSDDPSKVQGAQDRKDLQMVPHLQEALGQPAHELLLVSPYFVPGPGGTEALAALARRGVQVRVLTNSLAATDVGAVYSGYQRYREQLLRAGVHLHELKPGAIPAAQEDDERHRGIGVGVLRSLWIGLLSLLPIEHLL